MSNYYIFNYSESNTIDICKYNGEIQYTSQLGESLFSFLSLDLTEYEQVRLEILKYLNSKNLSKEDLDNIIINHPEVASELSRLEPEKYSSIEKQTFLISEALLYALIVDNEYISNHSEILKHPYLMYSDIFYGETNDDEDFFDGTDLLRLQSAYKKAIPFCFDIEYDPLLNELTAYERYYLFIASNRFLQSHIEKLVSYKVIHTPVTNIENIKALCNIPKTVERINNIGVKNYDTTSKSTLISTAELVKCIKNISPHSVNALECDVPQSIAFNEFRFMLEQNVSIKKCKNCGNYFILKGDYATEYCDRIPKDSKFTCKKIAAINNRKEKLESNPILREYEKAYKRMYARNRNHKMTTEEFKTWVDNTTRQRDLFNKHYEDNPNEDIIKEFKQFLGNK